MLTFTITSQRYKGCQCKKVADIYKTKYGKMVMIDYELIFISTWLTEQQ